MSKQNNAFYSDTSILLLLPSSLENGWLKTDRTAMDTNDEETLCHGGSHG